MMLALVALALGACNNKEVEKDEKACCSKELPALESDKSALPEQSLYQVTSVFENQDSQAVKLDAFRGKPTIISMIFTNCGYACPRLTADIKEIEKSLGANADKVNFVMVSFDTERDIPSQLKSYAKTNDLGANWTLLHGDIEAVRTIGVLLNTQFEKDADGNFSHSNLVSVLNKDGEMQFQQEGLGADQSKTVEKINLLLK